MLREASLHKVNVEEQNGHKSGLRKSDGTQPFPPGRLALISLFFSFCSYSVQEKD